MLRISGKIRLCNEWICLKKLYYSADLTYTNLMTGQKGKRGEKHQRKGGEENK